MSANDDNNNRTGVDGDFFNTALDIATHGESQREQQSQNAVLNPIEQQRFAKKYGINKDAAVQELIDMAKPQMVSYLSKVSQEPLPTSVVENPGEMPFPEVQKLAKLHSDKLFTLIVAMNAARLLRKYTQRAFRVQANHSTVNLAFQLVGALVAIAFLLPISAIIFASMNSQLTEGKSMHGISWYDYIPMALFFVLWLCIYTLLCFAPTKALLAALGMRELRNYVTNKAFLPVFIVMHVLMMGCAGVSWIIEIVHMNDPVTSFPYGQWSNILFSVLLTLALVIVLVIQAIGWFRVKLGEKKRAKSAGSRRLIDDESDTDSDDEEEDY